MMNRRNFIKSCACAVAAALVGVKARAEEIVTGVGRGSPLLIDSGWIDIQSFKTITICTVHNREIIDSFQVPVRKLEYKF